MNDAFEKQLRDAWAKQDFPVDPDHRAAMESLLRKRDRRRPLIFWWLGGLLLLVVGVAGLVWFASRDVANAPSGTEAPIIKNAASAGIDNAETREAQSAADTHTVVPESTSSTQQQKSTDQINAQDEAGTSVPSEGAGRTQARRAPAGREAASTGKMKDGGKQPGIAGVQDVRVEPGTGSSAGEAAALQEVTTVTHVDEVAGLPEVPAVPSHAETDITAAKDAEQRTLIAVESVPGLNVTLLESGSPEVVAAAAISNQRRWYLFAETAGTYIPASKPESPEGWQLHAGAGVGFNLIPRLEGLLSAGYMMQDGGFSFSKSSTVRQLGFGVRSAFNTLTPDRLHHLYVKAGVQYRLRRHILSARAGICYLYGAQGDITVVQADQLSSGTVEQTTRTWLNTNGLRRVFGVADLGYGYQLTPALSAVAGLTWRPSPVDNADDALTDEGYLWKGSMPAWQGFLSLQYRFYGNH